MGAAETIAGFVDGPAVVVAAEAAKVSQLGRVIAAVAVAAISVATGTEAVDLTCSAELIAELVAAAVLSERGFVARTAVKIVAIVTVAAASVKGQLIAPFVAETVSLVVRMSTGMNSYYWRGYLGGPGYCLSAIVAAEAESKLLAAAHSDLRWGQVHHYLHELEGIFVVVAAVAAVEAAAVVVGVLVIETVIVSGVELEMVAVVVVVVVADCGDGDFAAAAVAVAVTVADGEAAADAAAADAVEGAAAAVGLEGSAINAAAAAVGSTQ